MPKTVQARLDEGTVAVLDDLVRRLGVSRSEIVREGIRLLDRGHAGTEAPRMIGIGMFASGVPDMGSNKKYLEGLGSNSGIGRRPSSKLQRKAS